MKSVGRLARYGRWQLRDYLVERGISTFLLGALILVVPTAMAGPAAREAGPALFAGGIGTFSTLGAIFALNGLSSTDRQRGYFRFLFSKPVSVPRFYLQDVALRLAGLLVVSLVLFAAFAALADAAVPLWALAQVVLTFVLVGGVGFLLAALTHHDGVALVAVLVLATLARAGATLLGWAGAGVAGALRFASTLLPPLHLLDATRDSLAAGTLPAPGVLLWVLAYGLGCLGAGLLVLRHRPLAT